MNDSTYSDPAVQAAVHTAILNGQARSGYVPDEITNNDDILDSRDVIARIEYLRELVQTEEATDEDIDELATLDELARQGEDVADWPDGLTLIRDSYFEDYAQEFAEDIGAINADASWPNNCIDWEQAARELQVDYTSLDFNGVTYWAR